MRGHARLVLRVCCVAGFATWCAAGFAAARAPKDPRKGVIQQLFGTSLPGAKLFSPSISKQKEMVLRKMIADGRSMSERTGREIQALEARLAVCDPIEQNAHTARIRILRRETAIIERRIDELRLRVGKVTGFDGNLTRPGLYGAIARGYENFVATEERSARVMFKQMQRKGDAWGMLREDAASLLRLGSNVSLAGGYLGLKGSTALLPHAAAIIARANKLETLAPGILDAVSKEEALPLVEPHLDTILERLDEIEPFMPFVLENLEALAPCAHCPHSHTHAHARIDTDTHTHTLPAAPRPTLPSTSQVHRRHPRPLRVARALR